MHLVNAINVAEISCEIDFQCILNATVDGKQEPKTLPKAMKINNVKTMETFAR